MPEDQVVIVEESVQVEIINDDFPVTSEEDVTIVQVVDEIVSIVSVAEQGPPGQDGAARIHEQSFGESTEVVVNHNLGRYPPTPTVLTPGGAVMDALVINTNLNQFIVYFTFPTAGSVRYI